MVVVTGNPESVRGSYARPPMKTDLVLAPFGASAAELLAAAQSRRRRRLRHRVDVRPLQRARPGRTVVARPVRDAGGDRHDDRTDQRRRARRQRRQSPPGAARLRRQLVAIAGAWPCAAGRRCRHGGEQRVVRRVSGRSAVRSLLRRRGGRCSPRRSARCGRSGAATRLPANTSRWRRRWRSPTVRRYRRSSSVPPAATTIRVGCEHADGVNLLPEGDLAERVAFARANAIEGAVRGQRVRRPRRRPPARWRRRRRWPRSASTAARCTSAPRSRSTRIAAIAASAQP